MNGKMVLEVRNLSICFLQYQRAFKQRQLQVIRDLSVTLHEGELVAVVGASGSGKSLLAHAIFGILPQNASMSGEMLYKGEPLTAKRVETLRGKEIVLVPQSVSALDPLMKVGPQVRKGRNDRVHREQSRTVLKRYGLEESVEQQYPFELSGGMARRVLISTAVVETPKLVIADEPTPGLHITAAKRVLSHFREIADDGAAVLLITHDLELAAAVADRVVVFYAGTTIEEAAAADFKDVRQLRHPYTRALWHAMPQHGFHAIEGVQPYAGEMPEGCPFITSCAWAEKQCRNEVPYQEQAGGFVRCRKNTCTGEETHEAGC